MNWLLGMLLSLLAVVLLQILPNVWGLIVLLLCGVGAAWLCK